MSGLLAFRTNAEIDQMERERRGEAAPSDPNHHLLTRLDDYVEKCWLSAFEAKRDIERQMIDDLHRRAGKYTPEKEAEMKAAGMPPVFMNITSTKARAAEGWLMDIIMPAGQRPFTAEHTPVPEMPEDVKAQIRHYVMTQLMEAVQMGAIVSQQDMFDAQKNVKERVKEHMLEEAKRRAAACEDVIDDYAWEGDWYEAMEDAVSDLVNFPNCFIKGPVMQRRKRLQWVDGEGLQPTEQVQPVFYAVSPFNMYPSANSRGINDGYLFELGRYRRSDLYGMIGLPGVSEVKMRAALDEYQSGHRIERPFDQQLQNLDYMRSPELSPDQTIDVKEFHGWVRGEWLIEWGMDPMQVTDADAEYQVELWKIGRHTVRVLFNDHPLGMRPYHTASYDRRPGSFWGWGGLIRAMADVQDICNAAVRALVFNMGITSGPQVEVEVDRLAEGQEVTRVRPWGIWQTKSSKVSGAGRAVNFFTPDSQAAVLQGVFDYFSTKADEYTGIPSYATGIPTSKGAASTASGMSMLMSAATRQMKRVVMNLDRAIEGSIGMLHAHVLMFHPDDSIKGDSYVLARGSTSLIAKEQQQMRKTEFLAMTANPIDSQIIGPEGRAELLRDIVTSFDIPTDKIIPNREQLVMKAQQAMMAQMQAGGVPPQAGGGGGAMMPDGSPAGGGDSNLFGPNRHVGNAPV
jgi:hypothetical protein